MTKIYLRQWFPGLLFSENSDKEVTAKLDRPELAPHAYAWQYFEQAHGEQNGEPLYGKPKNFTKLTYVGEELTPERAIAEATGPSAGILKANIEGNGIKRLVRTKGGRIFPLHEGETVVSPEPAPILQKGGP